MAVRHCRHSEDLQGTRLAVGRHAVGFFYANAPDSSGDSEVVTATRLFFDSSETEDLTWILDTLIERAGEYAEGAFDPRVHLCNRVESMSPTANLLGIGVTTVSEPTEPAGSSAYTALGMNRPYHAVARMFDGTDLLIRCNGGFLEPVDVRSTQTLNLRGMRTRHWEWFPPHLLWNNDTELPYILPRLSTLLEIAAGLPSVSSAGSPATGQQVPRRRHRGRGRQSGLQLRAPRRR